MLGSAPSPHPPSKDFKVSWPLHFQVPPGACSDGGTSTETTAHAPFPATFNNRHLMSLKVPLSCKLSSLLSWWCPARIGQILLSPPRWDHLCHECSGLDTTSCVQEPLRVLGGDCAFRNGGGCFLAALWGGRWRCDNGMLGASTPAAFWGERGTAVGPRRGTCMGLWQRVCARAAPGSGAVLAQLCRADILRGSELEIELN